MKLTIPNISAVIRLADYAPEFGEEVIRVWVNPPRALLIGAKEQSAGEVFQWYSEIWSIGGDTWTAEEVKELAEAMMEKDPQLWAFVTGETARLIIEHRKKKVVISSDKPQS